MKLNIGSRNKATKTGDVGRIEQQLTIKWQYAKILILH